MNRNRLTLGQALLLYGICLVLPANGQVIPGWTLVWADEFAQPDGSAPDTNNWVFDLGGNGWGNNELQTYTDRRVNSRSETGRLVIEARQEAFTGTDGIPRNYTSARLKTKGKHAWTYGRLEARIQVPRGKGLWPAFWMLGANFDSVGWPACGEIDILEHIGREPRAVYGTIHGPGYSGGNGIGGNYLFPPNVEVANEFHLFAVEWETNRIRWFVDGLLYFTVTPASLPGGAQWVFDRPEFLLMNVAVGGNWPGNPDGTTIFPQQMLVDYVRVYARSNGPASGTNALTNPGFEAGWLANWIAYGAGFNTVLENINNVPVHDGTNVFKVFGQFTGGENYSGIFQDKPSSPGRSYTADGWIQTTTSDRIAGRNSAWIEVSFRDAATNTLALYRTGLIDTNTLAGVWIKSPVTSQLDLATFTVTDSVTNLVAPAGTAWIRYQVVFRQLPGSDAGSVLFDDLALNPAIAGVLASIGSGGGNVNISFATQPGAGYHVFYKSELQEQTWNLLTTIAGDGSLKSVADPATAPHRFYTVIAQ